jgi:hypothetical protein
VNSAEYATALALASAPIVAAVHRADDPTPYINSALGSLDPPDGVHPVYALVTVLCAQIDPDTNLEDRLAWTVVFDPAVSAALTPKSRLIGDNR